jgi:hypothetical protein
VRLLDERAPAISSYNILPGFGSIINFAACRRIFSVRDAKQLFSFVEKRPSPIETMKKKCENENLQLESSASISLLQSCRQGKRSPHKHKNTPPSKKRRNQRTPPNFDTFIYTVILLRLPIHPSFTIDRYSISSAYDSSSNCYLQNLTPPANEDNKNGGSPNSTNRLWEHRPTLDRHCLARHGGRHRSDLVRSMFDEPVQGKLLGCMANVVSLQMYPFIN